MPDLNPFLMTLAGGEGKNMADSFLQVLFVLLGVSPIHIITEKQGLWRGQDNLIETTVVTSCLTGHGFGQGLLGFKMLRHSLSQGQTMRGQGQGSVSRSPSIQYGKGHIFCHEQNKVPVFFDPFSTRLAMTYKVTCRHLSPLS
jgi:hypothetical protein